MILWFENRGLSLLLARSAAENLFFSLKKNLLASIGTKASKKYTCVTK